MFFSDTATRTLKFTTGDVHVTVEVVRGRATYTCIKCILGDPKTCARKGEDRVLGVASHMVEHLTRHKRYGDIVDTDTYNAIRSMAVEEQSPCDSHVGG